MGVSFLGFSCWVEVVVVFEICHHRMGSVYRWSVKMLDRDVSFAVRLVETLWFLTSSWMKL